MVLLETGPADSDLAVESTQVGHTIYCAHKISTSRVKRQKVPNLGLQLGAQAAFVVQVAETPPHMPEEHVAVPGHCKVEVHRPPRAARVKLLQAPLIHVTGWGFKLLVERLPRSFEFW